MQCVHCAVCIVQCVFVHALFRAMYNVHFVVCSGVSGGGGADSARHFEGIELFPARHLLEQYGLERDEDHK